MCGSYSSRRSTWLSGFRFQWYDVLFIVRLAVSLPGEDAEDVIVSPRNRDRVHVRVLKAFVVTVLRKTLMEVGLEVKTWFVTLDRTPGMARNT